MLTALMLKDMRVNRLPLVAGMALLILPYGVAAMAVGNMPLWEESTRSSGWALLLATGSYFSIMCSQAALVMLSGNIIAAERTDRSAEFLAYLPPSRRQILLSKFLVLLGAASIVWLMNLGIGGVSGWLADDMDAVGQITSDLPRISSLASIGLCAIGIGWGTSAMLNSSGPAVALGLAGPLAVSGFVSLYFFLAAGQVGVEHFSAVCLTACPVVGAAAFVGGTVYYLRRVEP